MWEISKIIAQIYKPVFRNDDEKRESKMMWKVQPLGSYENRFTKICLSIKWYQEVKEGVRKR